MRARVYLVINSKGKLGFVTENESAASGVAFNKNREFEDTDVTWAAIYADITIDAHLIPKPRGIA